MVLLHSKRIRHDGRLQPPIAKLERSERREWSEGREEKERRERKTEVIENNDFIETVEATKLIIAIKAPVIETVEATKARSGV